MLVKKHVTSDGRLILAVCDSSLLGKEFEEDDKVLDLSGDFFKGDEIEEEELDSLLEGAYIVNAVGEESVGYLKSKGLVDKITKVEGVPHVQIVTIRE